VFLTSPTTSSPLQLKIPGKFLLFTGVYNPKPQGPGWGDNRKAGHQKGPFGQQKAAPPHYFLLGQDPPPCHAVRPRALPIKNQQCPSKRIHSSSAALLLLCTRHTNVVSNPRSIVHSTLDNHQLLSQASPAGGDDVCFVFPGKSARSSSSPRAAADRRRSAAAPGLG